MIASKADLIERLSRGEKPKADWRIGTEHEKFGFHRADLSPMTYEGPGGVRAVLDGLADRFGWTRVFEGGNVIALEWDGASVSLEPGGQLELSGAPLLDLHQTHAETRDHLDEVRAVCDPMGVGYMGLGFSPLWSLAQTPIMPKGRYGIMRNYMEKVGRLGRQMMFRSCTVQVNLDFSSEADMVKKFRTSLALQPVVTALFANSPFAEGRTNGFQSYRGHVWTDTDPDRTGLLPFVFEEGFGYERYVDWALDVPMYFVKRDTYLDASGQSFRDFLAGRLPVLPGQLPRVKDWDDHLTTLFPDVRLKSYLEMRGADAGQLPALCALPALFTGLLYDQSALDAAWDLVKHWTQADRQSLRSSVPMLALEAPVAGTSVHAIAREMVAIAAQGLKARACTNAAGHDEAIYLDPLQEILASGRTNAQSLLELWRGPWGKDVRGAFTHCAF